MTKLVLVVDDYADTRSFMRLLIEMEGHGVVTGANGLEAAQLVEKEFPNLIFMDLAMPVMDGFTAARRIRSLPGGENVPIVAFTATGRSLFEEAVEAGCNDLLIKPVDPAALNVVFRRYLEPQI